MKKLILLLIVILSVLSFSVYADDVKWSYNDGVLTLTGEGNVYFSIYNIKDFPSTRDIHTLVLSEGITNVPVISGMEYSLKSIHLPTTVETVYYTIYKYTALESVTVADGGTLTVTDGVLFNGDTLVCYPAARPDKSYTVPSNTRVIDSVAFTNAQNLVEIKIPNSVTTINGSAFYNCTNLSSVSLPSTLTGIPTACFSTCTSLTSIKLPDSITSIGDSAFYKSGLKSITIPKNVSTIEANAFSNCIFLEAVSFDCDRVSIGEKAFAYTKITSITFPKTDSISAAFEGTSINKVFIPREVKRINLGAFPSTMLKNVYYEGTDAEWSKIIISPRNDGLKSAAIEYNSLPFIDISQKHWAFSFVKTLYDNKTVGGTSRTTFEPDATLTWGQAMKMLLVSSGHGEKSPTDSHWASGYMSYAKSLGIVKDGTSPDAKITRLEFCESTAKLKGISDQPDVNPFKDTSNASVLALYKKGIIGGTSATTFEPNATLTRAQISKIICLLGQ
ncbi:MAG: leucine-rich repeat protein [Clostridia bacterium]|nr:leucine-rich repeat protein [Clostridia bacterium]